MLKESEEIIEEFYDLEVDVSGFFPRVANEHKSKHSSMLKHQMNVLVLSSYSPGILKLMKKYKENGVQINQKLKDGKKLHASERVLLVKSLLGKIGHNVLFGNRDSRDIRNVSERTSYLMEECNHILTLLTNCGGVLCEHERAVSDYRTKTVNYVCRNEKLSNFLLKGTFLLPGVKVIQYGNDNDLADLVIRTTEAYCFEHYREKEGLAID